MNLKIPVMITALLIAGNFSSYAVAQTDPALTTEEANALIWVREEEKLARDTYITLYDQWNFRIFNNISRSEQMHMDAMLTLLTSYGIPDPITDDTVGVFTDPILDDLYDKLITDGSVSLLDALYVGAFIEELDIKDIREAVEESVHTDINDVYDVLLEGSYKHMRAFVGQIEAMGVVYEAQVLEQSEVNEILGESGMTAQMADGNWMISGHNGEGMIFDVTVDGLFIVYWFTYDNEGRQMWLVGFSEDSSQPGVQVELRQYGGTVFGPQFNPDDVVSEIWGNVEIHFKDCMSAEANYESVTGSGAGSLELERIYYVAGSLCQPE